MHGEKMSAEDDSLVFEPFAGAGADGLFQGAHLAGTV